MTARRKASPGPRAPRERGTGSITSYPTKGGPRWRFEILAPVDPARPGEEVQRHSRGGFASYDDADVELTLLRADLIRGVATPIGRDTFIWVGIVMIGAPDPYGASTGAALGNPVDVSCPGSAGCRHRPSRG